MDTCKDLECARLLKVPTGSIRYVVVLIVILGIVVGETSYYYYEASRQKDYGPVTSPGSGGKSGTSGTSGNSGSGGSTGTSAHPSCIPFDGTTYAVTSTLINYGNGTSIWHNATRAPATWNLYNLTLMVADCKVSAEYYSIYNSHYVVSIDGVTNNDPVDWILWKFCQTDRAWSISQEGADLLQISDGAVYAWYYQDTSGTWQPPVQGAATVAQCS